MLHGEHISVSKRKNPIRYKKHWHNYYEIIFYKNCSGYCILNGEKYEVTGHCLFLLTPKDFHEISLEDRPEAHVFNISFSEQIVDPTLLNRLLSGPIVVYEIFDSLNTHIGELYEVFKNDSVYRELHLKCLFNDILIRIIEKGQTITSISNDIHPIIRESITYMLANPTENITLDILSKKFGVSKTYFSHLFHDNTGVSFKQYQITLRIEYAKRMLEEQELPIINISYECGFNTQSHFNRIFKNEVGMAPSEYRALKGK